MPKLLTSVIFFSLDAVVQSDAAGRRVGPPFATAAKVMVRCWLLDIDLLILLWL
jgi:hypothetical protein